jgi:hypothetical protein
MDSATRIVTSRQQGGKRLSYAQDKFKDAMAAYKKAKKDGDEKAAEKAKDDADRYARSVVGSEGW